LLQLGIEYERTITALKTLAKILLDHIYTIKIESERIAKKVIKIKQPLHVICARDGISHRVAERIASINPGIKNPTFTFGEVSIYV